MEEIKLKISNGTHMIKKIIKKEKIWLYKTFSINNKVQKMIII